MDSKKTTRTLLILSVLLLVVSIMLPRFNFSSKFEFNRKITTVMGKPLPSPKMVIDSHKKYTAIIKTSQGDISVNLYSEEAPIAVNSFMYLSRKGFYNDTFFHRTIKDFMIQGGDPTGTGAGGPGYTFIDEPITGMYRRGVLAMANAGPNTNGSQFFILQKCAPFLERRYVVFGEIYEGFDVLDSIANGKTTRSEFGDQSKPIQKTYIERIEITDTVKER